MNNRAPIRQTLSDFRHARKRREDEPDRSSPARRISRNSGYGLYWLRRLYISPLTVFAALIISG